MTSFVFGLDEWHQIGFILGGRGSRVPKFDTERNVAVPKIVDTNVRQIGYLGAAGQFFVKGCTGHVKYPVIWGQAV